MSYRFTWLASAAAIISLTRPAIPQSANFGGPISGFVYSHVSRMIRPLFGVPGATYAGEAVMKEVDSASIAPDGVWAFIAKQGRSGGFVGGLSALSPSALAVEGLIDAVDRVAWSRDGSYALLYSTSGNELQRVRFSTSGASADPPLDLSPFGAVTVMAIDPTGQNIAFGIAGSGLYFFNPGQSPTRVAAMSQPVALAFDATGANLYAADLGQGQIVEFNPGAGPFVFASLTQPNGSTANPVGLAVSGGSRYLLLADSAGQAVRVYDTATQNLVNTISLAFAPSRLEAVSSSPSFLLNGGNSGESLLILDASQAPGVYFVPAPKEARK
jgi:hypothetical protein